MESNEKDKQEYVVSNYSANKYITWFVVISFFLLIIGIIKVIYDRNQVNNADPNNYTYVRIFHPSSNKFIVSRVIPIEPTITIDDSTTNIYAPIMSADGTNNDALGTWQFIFDKSTKTYTIQHAYTGKYAVIPGSGNALSYVYLTEGNLAMAGKFIISSAIGQSTNGIIISPFSITEYNGLRSVTYSPTKGLLAQLGTPTTFVLRTPVTI